MFTASREKRRYTRLAFCIPVRYRKITPDIQESKGSLTKDISERGAKMITYEFLPPNLTLIMEMPLISEMKPVKGICRVAWVAKTGFSERYDVGIEFVNLDQGDQARIAKFVFSESISERTINEDGG